MRQAIQAQGCDGDRAGALRRLHAAMRESMERHADEQAAVELAYYVIVPFLPDQAPRVELAAHVARRPWPAGHRGLGAVAGCPSPCLARSLHLTDRSAPTWRRSISTHLLDGSEVLDLLWRRFGSDLPIARRTAGPVRASSAWRSSASWTPPLAHRRRPGPRGRCPSWSPRRGSTGRPAPPAGRPRPRADALCRHVAGRDRVRVAAGGDADPARVHALRSRARAGPAA